MTVCGKVDVLFCFVNSGSRYVKDHFHASVFLRVLPIECEVVWILQTTKTRLIIFNFFLCWESKSGHLVVQPVAQSQTWLPRQWDTALSATGLLPLANLSVEPNLNGRSISHIWTSLRLAAPSDAQFLGTHLRGLLEPQLTSASRSDHHREGFTFYRLFLICLISTLGGPSPKDTLVALIPA